MDWFKTLTGFREISLAHTQRHLHVQGDQLHSRVNSRHWAVGHLETPNLQALRAQMGAAHVPRGRLQVHAIAGDALSLHTATDNQGALFQVASQFNLLEMSHPSVTPEDGVTRYAQDPTQGPACAVAAGAATIYRNSFAPVGQQTGQTNARQINTLADLTATLGHSLIEMRNGYAMANEAQLAHINQHLAALDAAGLDALRASLRIGLHWGVEVTAPGPGQGQRVSQAFCSALPVAYNQAPTLQWQALACLVLEAAYEATLCAAALNAARGQCRRVYLTLLGGGVFGNPRPWILHAIERALSRHAQQDLTVFLVSHGTVPQDLHDLAQRCRQPL